MSSTGNWLSQSSWVDIGLVLLIEGLDLAFTTSDDAAGLSAAWGALSDWSQIRSGLQVSGTVEQSIQPFSAEIQPTSVTFSIVDVDDLLAKAFLGAARPTVQKIDLEQTLGRSDPLGVTTQPLDGVFGGGIGTQAEIYVGNETISAINVGSAFSVIQRGVRSLAGTSTDPQHIGKRAEVDGLTGVRPQVSSEPLTWANRGVSLFVSNRVNGVWSAGLPGTTSNDAELVWTGRIKSWSDNAAGTFTLSCESIEGRLLTTLLAHQYSGAISDGIVVTDFDRELGTAFQTFNTADSTTVAYPADFSVAWGTWAGTGRMSAEEIINSISLELQNRFVTNAGTFAPSTFRLSMAIFGDGKLHVRLFALPGTLPGYIVDFGIYLAPRIWQLLGWGASPSLGSRQRSGTSLDTVVQPLFLESRDLTLEQDSTLDAAPPDRPTRSRLEGESGEQFAVTPDSGLQSFTSFVAQPFVGAGLNAGDANGFLLIGGKRLFGVKQVAENLFELANEVTDLFSKDTVNASDPKDLVNETEVSRLDCKQVWLETGTMGSILLRLLASTGTAGYNHPDHDVYPTWMSVGVPWSLLHATSIRDISDTQYTLLLQKPTSFQKIIEAALNFASKHLVMINGQLKCVSLSPGNVLESDITLTEDNKAKQVSGARDQVQERIATRIDNSLIVNRATLKFNQTLDGSFQRTITVNATSAQQNGEQARGPTIEGIGLYDVASSDGKSVLQSSLDSWAKLLTATALAYFSTPVGTITRPYDFSIATRIYPSARISISDSAMINPATGNRGVTDLLCWCISNSFDWTTGVGTCTLVYQPSRASERFRVWAPSGRVSSYDDASKTLTLLPHQYSLASEEPDAASFEVGDAIRVVELSPVGSPQTWLDTVVSVDIDTNTVQLTNGLAGFDPSKTYVLEYGDVALATQTQRSFHAFLDSNSSWDGMPDPVDAPYTTNARYQRPNFIATDPASPASVHKMGELSDWVNTALVYHTAPVYVNQLFAPSPIDVETTQYQTVCGPLFIPLYFGSSRRLIMRALIKQELGTAATMRFVSSVSRPAGPAIQGFFDPTYVDVAAGGANWGTVSRFQVVDYEWVEAIVSPKVTTKDGVPGCYVTLDVSNLDTGMTTHVWGWYVAEEHSA